MTPERLSTELRAAAPATGELVYLERRGEDYSWSRGEVAPTATLPDAWLYYSGRWPVEEEGRWQPFFDDLLAELDAMVTGADRCRWSPDNPWPHGGLGH